MVGGPVVATGFSPARVLANLHRGFAINAQALDLSRLVGVCSRDGLAVLFGEVGKDGICFREFFWGLALTTLRRRYPLRFNTSAIVLGEGNCSSGNPWARNRFKASEAVSRV
jgi:hypothetical protein